MPPRNKTVRSVAFVSLGCPKNLVDSERMLGLLAEDGLTITADPATADAIVINTCGFLEASRQESLKEIHEAIALKKDGQCQRVIVAGCLVQRHKTKLLADAPGIDRLVGVFDREHIVRAVHGVENTRQEHGHYLGKYHDLNKHQGLPVFEDDRSRLRLTPRHYAYLRISEGCNQGCAFCTIPGIRGAMRSKPLENILAEARELAADGAVELNLIGQDTTSYGTDLPPGSPNLAALLKTLDRQLKDVHWLRLMYAYPSCFTDEMIDAIAQTARVVKYIDIPLQHINDEMLTLMKRRVTRKQIETLLNKLRKIPGMAIRTTMIAGSPGETQAQHRELLQFIRDFQFDMLGVFPYSPEPGTPMGRLTNQLPDELKNQRVEELMLAQQEIAFAKSKSRVGELMELLIDRPAGRDVEDGYVGRTQSQAPDIDSVVHVNSNGAQLHPGQLIQVRITDYQNYDLVAEIPKKRSRMLKVVTV